MVENADWNETRHELLYFIISIEIAFSFKSKHFHALDVDFFVN